MKILLIEDEKDIASLCRVYLQKKGHGVTLAVDGQAGIDTYMRESNLGFPFDLVVTDFRMPIKSGADVINEILAVNPRQRIILATAFGDDYARVARFRKERVPVLTKPFGFDDLGKLVQEQVTVAEIE